MSKTAATTKDDPVNGTQSATVSLADAAPWEGRLISADSHVVEPVSAWEGVLDASFWPQGTHHFDGFAGGSDPAERIRVMDEDRLLAEVLYPTLGLKCFAIPDPELHAAACRAYNVWLANYCAYSPSRLIGIGMIPCFDADRAIEEIRFCRDAGFRGILVWQTPHPDLPFTGDHYDRIWEEAIALDLPVSMHVLTGFNYSTSAAVHGSGPISPLDFCRSATNQKLLVAADAVYEFVVGGVLERFPELKIVLVENEVGWLPFVVNQWDYYYSLYETKGGLPITMAPSKIFRRQVYVTYFRDEMAPHLFNWWGADNCMWSNDYPHKVSTWPYSRQYVAGQFEYLDEDVQEKLAHLNVEALYHLDV